MVSTAHRLAYAGILFLALTLAGVMVLIFGAVGDLRAGIVAGSVTALAIAIFWLGLPLWLRMRAGPPD